VIGPHWATIAAADERPRLHDAQDFVRLEVTTALSETPLQYWRHAPTVGQDKEYVYMELLGYSPDEYRDLVDRQLDGTTFLDA
jgi:crotonobetainyl-CoA:carnitine CoA-transferase CaiB-like acyl-CoA transferase